MDKPAMKALEAAAAAANEADLPSEGEFYYYSNFGEFSGQVGGLMSRVQALLTSLPGATAPAAGILDDAGDAHAWATGMIDDALERVDDAVAATKRDAELTQRAQTSSAVPPMIDIDLGANAVRGRPVDVASQRAGARQGEFVSFMQSTYAERPQEAFIGGVDNRNAPFVPDLSSLRGVVDVDAVQAAVAAAAAADATMPHPLAAQLQTLQYPASQLQPPAVTTGPHRAFEDTPFEVIDTLQALQAAAARLAGAGELAVDLEAHNYRSFQGFCCLMQLSTRQEDMVIDVLALRQHIGPALAPIFADPAVVKVLHGSDGDIIWLQRDFGIYIVNMFDTGQAARVLGHCGHGLGHLLDRVCGFKADKRWQLADWRVRPLSPEALHYARADTHFLLHCYDALRAELLKLGPGAEAVPEELRVELPAGAPRGALGTVLERSRRLCLVQYERERLRPDSFMTLYEKTGRVYTDEQLAVFAALYAWRDRVAREEDESTGFVLARAQLLNLVAAMPLTAADVAQALGRAAPVATRRAAELAAAVRAARTDPGPTAEVRRLWQARPQAAAAAARRRNQPAALPRDMQVAAFGAAGTPDAESAVAAQPLKSRAALIPANGSVAGGLVTAPPAAASAAPSPVATIAPAPVLQRRTIKPLSVGGALPALAAKKLPAGVPTSAAGSAFGSLLGGGGGNVAAAVAVEAIKASLALPFSFAADPRSPAVAAPSPGQAAVEPAVQHAEQAQPTEQRSQRDVVRAALDAMSADQRQEGGEQQGMEPAAAAAATRRHADVEAADDFMPLALSDKYRMKQGRKRRAQQATAAGRDGRAAATEQGHTAKQRLVDLGLEDGDAEDSGDGGGGAEGGLDFVEAKRKYDLGITNPHARQRGRGRGQGRDGDARGGARAGGSGRGGRGRTKNDSSVATRAFFNPYASGPDLAGVKGGKRSAVHVRSGNKSGSFR